MDISRTRTYLEPLRKKQVLEPEPLFKYCRNRYRCFMIEDRHNIIPYLFIYLFVEFKLLLKLVINIYLKLKI